MSAFSRLKGVFLPDLAAAVRRFPVPVAAALIATFIVILRIEKVFAGESDLFSRLYFAVAIAFGAGVAGRIALESRDRSAATIVGHGIPVVLGAAAGLSVFSLWMTPTLAIAALALAVVAAPGLSPGATPIQFWIFNTRSIFAGLVGTLGAVIFVLGFWGILKTLGTLFDLHFSNNPISYAVAVSFNLMLPIYWLALLPKVSDIGDEEPQPDVLIRAIAALTDFVFIPLLVIYAVILHVYAVKIAIDATLPRGQIGWIVSIFLALGYLTLLLALPERSPVPSIRRLFRALWPPATLVPAGLLALALQKRVAAYGITEDRYLTGLAAMAAVILFGIWLVRRRLDIRIVPVVAASLLLVGAVGPLAARLMTVHSQAQRFIAVLDASGELKDGRFDGERTTPWGQETRNDLRSIAHLLERRRALHLVAPVMGAEVTSSARTIGSYLGLDRAEPAGPIVVAYARIGDTILTNHFSWFSWASTADRLIVFRASGEPEYLLTVESRRAVLSGPEGKFAFDLSAEPRRQTGSAETHPRLVGADNPGAMLILRELRRKGSEEDLPIDRLSGQFLIRIGPGKQ